MRNFQGQFTSLKKGIKWFIKRVIIVMVVFTGIVAGIMYLQYHTGGYAARASQIYNASSTPAKPSLGERWEENFQKDVELEMQRSGFKIQMAKYAKELAEKHVIDGYLTKLEQKVK